MPDLVDLVRDELARAAADVTPSPGFDDRVRARLTARARRRRAVALAAAAVVAAVALAVPALAGGGERPDAPDVLTDEGTIAPHHLLPDALPTGYTLVDAHGDGRLGGSGPPAGAAADARGTTARWATFAADGTVSQVVTVTWGVGAGAVGDAEGVLTAMDRQGATPVGGRGTEGWLAAETGTLAWREPDGTVVMVSGGTAPSPGGDLVVPGVLAPDVVLGIADSLAVEASGEIVAPALVEGWSALGQWPRDAAPGTGPRDARWAGPAGEAVQLHLVAGAELPPEAFLDVTGAHRATVGDREAVVAPAPVADLPTVGGHPGLVEAADLAVVWRPEPGTQVTLSSRGLSEAGLLAFAESLRPATEEEWLALTGPGGSSGTASGGPATSTAPSVPPAPPADAPVQASGTFEGVEAHRPGTDGCRELTRDLDATLTLDADGARWVLHVDHCGRYEGDDIRYGEGSFTLTLAGGDTITGTTDDIAPRSSAGKPYALVATGGTGAFAGAAGSCLLDDHLSDPALADPVRTGTFTCGITPGASAGTG